MIRRLAIALYLCLALAACREVDGLYAPACAAFEGTTIRLDAGRYERDRFTDMVTLDDDGNVVPAFPGYPQHGSYALDGDRLTLTQDAGGSPLTMFLVPRDGRLYLLDAAAHAAVAAGGAWPDCALVLGGDEAQ